MATTGEMIGIVLVTLLLIVTFTVVLSRYLSTIVELFAKTSAENVARQLSALITTSAISPYEIKIDYIPSKDVNYKIYVFNRNLKIVPRFEVGYAEKGSSTQSFAINLENYERENINHFHIEKEKDGETKYVFYAKKE